METWTSLRGKGDGSLGIKERKGMETWALVRGKADGSLGIRERKGMEWDHSGKGQGMLPEEGRGCL